MNESDKEIVNTEEEVNSSEETVTEETVTEEVVAEEAPAEEVVAEEVVTEEAPAEEVVAEEAEVTAPVISTVERSPAQIVSDFEKKQIKTDLPSFRPGDTVVVSVKVKEGDRTRLQAFEGVVMGVKQGGLNASFIVRKISSGIGVERTFQTHSPMIDSIVVNGIEGMPTGFYYSCSNKNCTFIPDSTGCATMEGTASKGDIGEYPLEIQIKIYAKIFGTVSTTQDDTIRQFTMFVEDLSSQVNTSFTDDECRSFITFENMKDFGLDEFIGCPEIPFEEYFDADGSNFLHLISRHASDPKLFDVFLGNLDEELRNNLLTTGDRNGLVPSRGRESPRSAAP